MGRYKLIFAGYTLLFSAIIPPNCYAGQISVINPSSGSEASGVVMMSTGPPNNVTSSGTHGSSLISNNAEFDQAQVLSQNMLSIISSYLQRYNIDTFTSQQKDELIVYIDNLIASEGTSMEVLKVLKIERNRLSGN